MLNYRVLLACCLLVINYKKQGEGASMDKTIQEVAKQMSDNHKACKRDDGSTYYHLKKEVQWQRDIINNLTNNDWYSDATIEYMHRALELFANEDKDATEDHLQELVYEIEPDVYNHDLTAWLAEHVNHMQYVDEILEAVEVKDCAKLLMMAQGAQISEVASATLQAIIEYINK